MKRVVDDDGWTWTIRRWGWRTLPWQSGFATLDAVFFLIMLPFMLMWPLWLAAKWLGVSWTVQILREGEKVGRERVRGWRKSGERIAELAAEAEAGTLAQRLQLSDSQ